MAPALRGRGALVVATAALLLACAVSLAAAAAGDFPDTTNCIMTAAPPSKPRSLSFCHKFNDNACCAPASDTEANEAFDNMLDLGLSCRLRGDVRHHPIAKFYCLACDPQQPRYVRNEPYVPFCSGDDCPTPAALYKYLPGTVFTAPADTPDTKIPATAADGNSLKTSSYATFTATLSPVSPKYQMILMCKDWVEQEFGTVKGSANYFSKFNKCGLIKSSPCLDVNGKIIPKRDRYLCGGDLIMPAETYDNVEQFFNAEQAGPPNFSDQFGFVIVENRQCAAADFLPNKKPEQGGFRENGGFDQFHPNCLRTVAQIKSHGVSMWSGAYDFDSSGATLDDTAYLNPTVDEMCFNSAASVVPVATLLLLSLLASLLLLL